MLIQSGFVGLLLCRLIGAMGIIGLYIKEKHIFSAHQVILKQGLTAMRKFFGFLTVLPLLTLFSCGGGFSDYHEAPLVAEEEFQEDIPELSVNGEPLVPFYYEWHSASLSETKELVQDKQLIPVLGSAGESNTVRITFDAEPVFAEINIFRGKAEDVNLDGDPDQLVEVTPDMLEAFAEGYLLEHKLAEPGPQVVTMTYQFHTPPGYEQEGMTNIVAWIVEIS